MIKAGKLRALAIASGQRIPGVNVPTLKEQGLDAELVNWRGIVAGPGITPQQRAALSAAIEKTVKSPAWAKILKARGWDDAYMNADQFAAYMKQQQASVKEVLTSIGLVK